MKAYKILSIFLIIVFFFSVTSKAEISDGVAAVVNDEVIFLSDLQSHIKESGDNPLNKKVYSKYLKELIDLKLLQLQGSRMGIDASDEKIDQIEKDVRKKNGDKVFEDELKKNGLSVYRLRFGWKNQMLQEGIRSVVLRNKIVITEKEIIQKYKKTYGNIQEENLVNLSMILIDTNKIKEGQIKSIEENLRASNNVDSLVDELLISEQIEPSSGSLGFVNPENLDKKVKSDINSSKEGDIIGPYVSENIIKFIIVGKKQFGDVDYIKNKDKIYETIYQEKSLTLLQKWFQELRDNAYISIRI
ncbi:MAG: hypothetical protein VX343_01155 [Thermodesulfobacteriota bacterium]|nr:hypothetical protein [Thermodesulfobacteriota bacterium]